MRLISKVPHHDKVKRYMKETEDFFLAYCLLSPRMDEFYAQIRKAYQELKELSENKDEVFVKHH